MQRRMIEKSFATRLRRFEDEVLQHVEHLLHRYNSDEDCKSHQCAAIADLKDRLETLHVELINMDLAKSSFPLTIFVVESVIILY